MTQLIADILNDYLHLACDYYGYKHAVSLRYDEQTKKYELYFGSKNRFQTFNFWVNRTELEDKHTLWDLFKTIGFGIEIMKGMKQEIDTLVEPSQEKDTSVQVNGCPKCKSAWVVKNGTRKNINGPVNRYKCNYCHYRFTMNEDKEE